MTAEIATMPKSGNNSHSLHAVVSQPEFYRDSLVTIINADARDIMHKLPRGLVVTDPPYNVGYEYDEHKDNMSVEEYQEMLRLTCPLWLRRSVRNPSNNNMSNSNSGWIGVDLDGTLAHYEGWGGVNHIGAPIAPMVERVKKWLAAGKTVKIFTARMHGHGMPIIGGGVEDVRTPIEAWCKEHLGAVLEITNVKDFGMIELWDDRAIQVESNTGHPVASCKDRKRSVQLKQRKGA